MDSVDIENDTERLFDGVTNVFDTLLTKYNKLIETADLDNTTNMDYALKIAGAIGYQAQVHASLAKAYKQEKRLSDIENKLEKIPPEIIEKYLKNTPSYKL